MAPRRLEIKAFCEANFVALHGLGAYGLGLGLEGPGLGLGLGLEGLGLGLGLGLEGPGLGLGLGIGSCIDNFWRQLQTLERK